MILLFNPAPPVLKWSLMDQDRIVADGVTLAEGDWYVPIEGRLDQRFEPERIATVCHNGGNLIRDPAAVLSGDLFSKLRGCVKFLPEHNDLTIRAAETWMKIRPAASHVLLCDSAFFSRLPPPARNYAIPYRLTRQGVRRYGRNGLDHAWAVKKIQTFIRGGARRVVSIHLGARSSLAAIRDGKPLDTTAGFTSVEGLMSGGACGDIDPTIVFQLKASGHSYREINRMLCNQSGFTALGCGRWSLAEILGTRRETEAVTARRVFSYQLLKQIGAAFALLGGADGIILTVEGLAEMTPFLFALSSSLGFAGVTTRIDSPFGDGQLEITSPTSRVRVFAIEYDPWGILADHAWSIDRPSTLGRATLGRERSGKTTDAACHEC